MSRRRNCLFALALLAFLVVSPVWGRTPQRRVGGASFTPTPLFVTLLSTWLGRTLPEDWLKGGCYIDPNGHCLPGTTSESGCLGNAGGGCAPSTFADAGCLVDPAGQCTPGH